MAKTTILTVKKTLAAAYPDIEFTYGEAGRGRQRAHCVSWVGGPAPPDIRHAAGNPYQGHFTPYHFVRQPTPEEREEMHRKWEEEHRTRVAAEPARRAAAKASGIEKRKVTQEAKKTKLAVLAAAFPGVVFTLRGLDAVDWIDGPERSEVAAVLGVEVGSGWISRDWAYGRYVTPEGQAREKAEKAAKVQACRLTKRLAASQVRAIRVAKGIERRRTAHLTHLPRLERNPRQFILPLDFPFWDKPPVYLSRVF